MPLTRNTRWIPSCPIARRARTGRGQPPPEVPPEVQARLAELEAGLKTLRAEVAGLKTAAAEAASLKATIAGLSRRTGRTAP